MIEFFKKHPKKSTLGVVVVILSVGVATGMVPMESLLTAIKLWLGLS